MEGAGDPGLSLTPSSSGCDDVSPVPKGPVRLGAAIPLNRVKLSLPPLPSVGQTGTARIHGVR